MLIVFFFYNLCLFGVGDELYENKSNVVYWLVKFMLILRVKMFW